MEMIIEPAAKRVKLSVSGVTATEGMAFSLMMKQNM
jgi:hypothetical protein